MKMSRLAALALLSVAGAGFTWSAEAFDAFISIGGEHRTTHPNGGLVELLATADQTDGQFSILTLFDAPGGGPGNGVTHTERSETFYVLQGEYEFYVGTETYRAGPGTLVVNPPKVPHGFKNIGTSNGTLLAIYSPGGFENFFTEWSDSGIAPGPELGALEAKNGVSRPPQ